ncbi:MAG TPA: DUF4145 domain-containing protein [Pirellulales bacterium]|nr:DUF4145 domain-containing protein [Pirellulales bacterium]
MKTLQDAWDWYDSTKTNIRRMQRLGSRHWNDDSLAGTSIRKDEKFKQIEADDIRREASRALDPIDDLGILVLFSVFESAVRDHLEGVVEPLRATLERTVLQKAADDALEGIKYGSFANNVLTPLQDQQRITAELSDKVKQVRDYRNWVAHGRREPRPQNVINLTASQAFARLKEFLDTLGIAVEAELEELAESSQPGSGEGPD